jgi:AcrR family transcriptional regulator
MRDGSELSNARGAPRRRLPAGARREVIERAATEVFAERGYHGASIDEIARRSGVSPPVVYDHFDSKRDLHKRLLERHRDDLLELWRATVPGDEPAEQRIARAIDAWARYVQANPYAVRMFFRETTGDPEVQAFHAGVQAEARAALVPILAQVPGAELLPEAADPAALEMAVELLRSALTGLAVWWNDHRDVPRDQVVATIMNVLWLGFERTGRGERWQAP